MNCPYCDHVCEIDENHLSLTSTEDETFFEDCPQCKKTFKFIAEFKWELISSRTDCLNGSPHDWQPVEGFRMLPDWVRCASCGLDDKGSWR